MVTHLANVAGRRSVGTVAASMSAARADAGGPSHPVCVVDDDESVRDSLAVLLETLGFEVLTHISGSEMLADQRRKDAGCLIVDQHMREIDGLSMLAVLRAEGVAVPTILITGRLDAAISARAAVLGVTAILEKPFPATRLVELVRASLERLR
jgi:two-component system response regulator FixJ